MSEGEQTTQTFGQEIEAVLKEAWGEIEDVGENVLAALKSSVTKIWAQVSSEGISFVQGVLANLKTDLTSGNMTLEQAITAVLNAAEAEGISELKALAPVALQALVASLIAAL